MSDTKSSGTDEKPRAQNEPDAPPSLKPPDRVTLRWLYEYVPYSLWASLGGILTAAFVLGITAAIKLPLVQQWFGVLRVEPNLNSTNELFHGYYYTWTKDYKDECSHEEVNLQFFSDGSIKAHSKGTMENRGGQLITDSWVLQGYKHNNNLVMAYVTERSDMITGNGVYYLVPNKGDYSGYWMGVNSPSGKVIFCPYVMTKTPKKENQKCDEVWPEVFSPAHGCKEVVFPGHG